MLIPSIPVLALLAYSDADPDWNADLIVISWPEVNLCIFNPPPKKKHTPKTVFENLIFEKVHQCGCISMFI